MRIKACKTILLVLGLLLPSTFCSGNGLDVIFSYKRGYYNESFFLNLSSTDTNAIIRYTVDCSAPSKTNGYTFSTDMEIDSTTVIKAIAYSSTDSSTLTTHTYLFPEKIKNQGKYPEGFPDTWGGSSTINADYEMDSAIIYDAAYADKITDAFKSLPALSLTMPVEAWFDPDTGNYVGYPNSEISREKAVSAEFIYADSTKNFNINCGVQNQGGTSIIRWKVPKQSMRLLFKDVYGPKKLRKKLFDDSEIESINTLVVDALLYSWVHNFDEKQRITTLYFRDQLCSDLQNDMGHASFHGFYVNLFINGLYWGIYDLHERPDEDFMEEYFDGKKEDFDVIKHNPNTIVAGSNDSYMQLLNKAREGFSSTESLEEINEYLDLPAFIDYMVLNYYLGNFDWAHQNYYASINKVEGTGFRFFTWDAEHVMRYSDVDYDATEKMDEGGPTEIHYYLKQNEEYRMMFADAFYKHAFNNGALSIDNFEKRFLFRKEEIELATILESARWGDYREYMDNITYTPNDHWYPEVDKVLTEYIPNRRDVVIEQLQRSDNLLYPNIKPPLFSEEDGIMNAGEKIEIDNPNASPSTTIIYTTNGKDPREEGGAIAGNVYSNAIEINGPTLIKARIFHTFTKEWSPLAEAYYCTDELKNYITISEIMYNLGFYDIEYIELMNFGSKEIDIIGLKFIDGIEYSFDRSTILQPGERIVLTNNMIPFKSLYDFGAYDEYEKILNNDGETILLADYFGNMVDSVSYSDTIPWPVGANGLGRSLELISADLDNALPTSWQVSSTNLGTPEEYISSVIYPNMANVQVYPNPANDWLNIILNDNFFDIEELNVEVYNNFGQLLKKESHYHNSNIAVHLNDIIPGLYFLRITGKDGKLKSAVTKFVKTD